MPVTDPTEPTYRVPLRFRLLRAVLRPIFRAIFHILSQVRIIGKENIPKQGPYLLAINHISLFEPPFILAFWPVAPEGAGAVEIWERKGQALLVRFYGGFQVHRGVYDRKVIDKMIAALRAGKPLLLAPEGGRSHTLGMRRALPGVAYLVEQTNVPVLPVGIVGTSDEFLTDCLKGKRPTIEMRIGKAIHLPPIDGKGATRRTARQYNADLIMLAIAGLLPPEYHGVYAQGLPSLENLTEEANK